MKKMFLAACAFLVMAAAASAQNAPAVKVGTLSKNGQMTANDLKMVNQLDLVDATWPIGRRI